MPRVPVGSTFQKKFGACGTFVGTVTSFDSVEDLYLCTYGDGDTEKLAWADLAKLLKTSGDTVTAPAAAQPLAVESPRVFPTTIPNGTIVRGDRLADEVEAQQGVVVAFVAETGKYEVRWSGGSSNMNTLEGIKRMMLGSALRQFAAASPAPATALSLMKSFAATSISTTTSAVPITTNTANLEQRIATVTANLEQRKAEVATASANRVALETTAPRIIETTGAITATANRVAVETTAPPIIETRAAVAGSSTTTVDNMGDEDCQEAEGSVMTASPPPSPAVSVITVNNSPLRVELPKEILELELPKEILPFRTTRPLVRTAMTDPK